MSALLDAAADGDLATIKRLHAEGVDMTERDKYGSTTFMVAAAHGHTATVKFLQASGASITERNNGGHSTLLCAALLGKSSMVQYLLQEAGASISEADDCCNTVWDVLRLRNADPVALASLLMVIFMLGDAPVAFVAKLSPAHTELTTRGRQYRAQLSSYLEQQRATVVAHCPLFPVLLPIVADYAATTPEDMWTDGLRVEATASDGRS
jgi:ankyrin repeat protein